MTFNYIIFCFVWQGQNINPLVNKVVFHDTKKFHKLNIPILKNFSEYYDDSDQKVREFYECPSPEDPPDHTRCCETESCCKLEHIDSVLGLDLKIAMIISLCVIVFCVFTGVVIIICCFAHQCPWYDTCSGSWDKDQSSIGKLFLN